MALASGTSLLPRHQPLLFSSSSSSVSGCAFPGSSQAYLPSLVHAGRRKASPCPISVVNAAEPSKVKTKDPALEEKLRRWSVHSWKAKKALQLPEYPTMVEPESVLHTKRNSRRLCLPVRPAT